jgi:ribosome-associated translation inhibitor RaiA
MADTEAAKLGFTVEYHIDARNLGEVVEENLKAEAEKRLHKLLEGHSDLTGAAVALTEPAERTTSFLYRARVVVYARPEQIAAVAEEEEPQAALKAALTAVERQVREKRDKLREPYKRP